MAELHTDKKSERKAKPQAKQWKSFPMARQAGKGASNPAWTQPGGWLSTGAES